MKTQMMCLIAALAIFTLPVDAAEIANQSIPITLSLPVPCGGVGEVVDLSGTINVVITFNPRHRRHRNRAMSSSGGDMRLIVSAEGVAGTGEITGRAFQGNDQFMGEINIPFKSSLLNGQGTVSFNTNFLITIAPGPDVLVMPFWWIDETVHVIYNADGTVTVNVDNFTADCGSCAGCWDYP